MFKVVKQTHELANTYTEKTLHTEERAKRARLVAKLGGVPVYSFLVDKDHEHGLEVHTILDSGVIVIGNYRTYRLVTWLIARPAQIKRYGVTDESLIAKARENNAKGYNE